MAREVVLGKPTPRRYAYPALASFLHVGELSPVECYRWSCESSSVFP